MAPRLPRLGPRVLAALAGVIAALAFLAVAELLALLVPSGEPLLAVGAFVIDVVPRPIKELAIELFGAADKAVLLGSVGLGVLALAAIAGLLARRNAPLGALVVLSAGGIGVAAAVTRAGASPAAAVPSAAGAVAGVAVLLLLAHRLPSTRATRSGGAAGDAEATPPASGVDRRGFLRLAGAIGAVSVLAAVGARVIGAATSGLAAVRDALTLPSPASTVEIPAGADLGIDGLSPIVTPNADFYRVDTALTVPRLDPATWSLRVTGMVDEELELSFDDLLAMGLDEYAVTLTCVSNVVGGDLVGNAVWLGVPVREVLARAGTSSDADMVLSRSSDGWTASTPLEACTDPGRDAILAVGMNGEPLPLEHGFPVRMVVPGLYGYVSATKWLTELKVTTFAEDEAYWTPRGYSAEAPIKLSSRVDTPRADQPVTAGPGTIAGVAWAQTVGIAKVEVSIDRGAWTEARLSTPISRDTWVQWALEWDPEPGAHTVAVRATDAEGTLQAEERAPIAPDGSTGWQSTLIQVRAAG